MSPRTRSRRGSMKSNRPNQGRPSRKSSAGPHSASPDQRPLVTEPSKTPKPGSATGPKRQTRSTSNQKPSNGGSDSENGGGADQDNENDDDNSDNSEEPKSIAPSGPITRKRGHQTGLSLTLSKTNIGAVQAGSKRELSVSTVDSETRTRPRKMSRVEQPPKIGLLKTKTPKIGDEDPSPWDSDYGAVDDISESDADVEDSDIERDEEQRIIESIEHETVVMSKRGRSVDSWADFTIDPRPVDDESLFFSEHFAVTEPNSDQDLAGKDRNRRTTSDPPPVRRVRFADLESSSCSSSNSEGEEFAFPDLLLELERVPSKLALNIAESEEDHDHFSDGSYWDLEGIAPSVTNRAKTPLPGTRQRSCSDSSGYETDTSEGETTDEDPVPPQTVNRPQANLRLVPDSSVPRKVFTRASMPRPPPHAQRGKGPCLGTWIADPAKPIGVVDRKTKKMLFVRPPAYGLPNSTAAPEVDATARSASAYASLPGTPNGQSDNGASELTPPNTAVSTQSAGADIMMSGLLSGMSGTGSHTSLGITGPPEAFYPIEDFDLGDPDDDDDPENDLDITDFIDFGDDSSDDNADGDNYLESEELTSPVTPLSTQKLPTIRPKQPKDRTSSQSLLSHFDKGIVSAFRRNQSRHQSVLRKPITGSRALAIKGGRHHAASTPISPIRKRRSNSGLDSMAPFTGLNATRMRKGTF